MGKQGSGTPQAKAEPKRKASGAEKETAASKPAPTSKDPKAGKAKEAAKAEPAKAIDPKEAQAAKLLEEAKQKLADDERDEATRTELRELNRKTHANGAKLNGNRDKSIPRVNKFQNKLRLFKGDVELQSVMNDIDGVDASRYVSELADCIMEASGVTVKLKELFSVVKVCTRLNATYGEFSTLLAKAIDKAYSALPLTELNRRRFLVRLCAELCLVECVPPDCAPFLSMMKGLADISASEEVLVINFTILASLVQKHAASCMNIVPNKQKAYEEALGRSWVTRSCCLSEAQCLQCMQLTVNAYQSSAAGLLQTAYSRLLEQEKVNQKLRIDKGQVDAENEQKHQQLKDNLVKLQTTFGTMSEYVNQPLPALEEEDSGQTRLAGSTEKKEESAAAADEPAMLWDDQEQQRFYEEVIDLKDVVPAVLLGLDKAAPAPVPAPDGDAEEEKVKPKKEVDVASEFDLYLLRIAKAEGAKQVDTLIQEFFHEHNTKGNRKQLASQLLAVPNKSLHLLPSMARIVAIVAPFLKEVPTFVLHHLQQDLERAISEKDPGALDSKVKTVRYLCELCKFKICPPGVILDAFKTLLDDFSQHHAELCTHILQCCGRFLLYTPETSTRTDNLLERMMRLKNVKSLPLQLDMMIEDAYYTAKPPESKRLKMKEKDPLERFTEHLIFERLSAEDEEDDKLLKLVRKLPWDGHVPGLLKKNILELNLHANYEGIYTLASLLSGLAKYRDSFVISVVDSLLENIQITLERNDFREAPVRVRQVKLIGELYNYRLVDSNLVFDLLYHFIGFGGPTMFHAGQTVTVHKIMERSLAIRKGNLGSISEDTEDAVSLPPVLVDPQHPVEAPWDFFRIKLVCVLLETCGHYFDRGAVKQKLDRFLQFFFRYMLCKGELPLRITYMVNDIIEKLRPKLVIPTSKAELDQSICRMLESERENLDLADDKGEPDADEDVSDDEESDDESSSEEDDESEDSDDEDSESESSSESDDDSVDYNRGGEGQTRHNEEIDEFDREMQQMLVESYEKEKLRPSILGDLPQVPHSSKRPEGGAPGAFSLLQKRGGGKTVVKSIAVPEDSRLAMVSRQVEEESTREKEDLKRFIMHNVENAAVRTDVNSSSMSGGGPLRAGKGKGKGGRGSQRKDKDSPYVSETLMPDDGSLDALQEPARSRHGPVGGIVIMQKSAGKGRRDGGSKGGASGGGKGRRGEQHGTPSQPARGSF